MAQAVPLREGRLLRQEEVELHHEVLEEKIRGQQIISCLGLAEVLLAAERRSLFFTLLASAGEEGQSDRSGVLCR